MEKIGNLLNKAEQEKSLTTTSQPSPPQWGALLWTLAQSRFKELTAPEIALWRAKLSGYPDDLVEWALVNYNGEFFPNPSTICQMIERKRETMYHEQSNAEWPAWRAAQAQAEREGRMATQEQYDELREKFKQVAFGPKLVKPVGEDRNGESRQTAALCRPGSCGPSQKPIANGDKPEGDTQQQTG